MVMLCYKKRGRKDAKTQGNESSGRRVSLVLMLNFPRFGAKACESIGLFLAATRLPRRSGAQHHMNIDVYGTMFIYLAPASYSIIEFNGLYPYYA